MLLSFALACLEMRTICYTLLYCSISVDVVVVFVQESSGNKIYKGRQYRLIPSASCLWRQEDVTVAVFFLSAHVCMLQVVLQTPVVAQIYGWRLNLNDNGNTYNLTGIKAVRVSGKLRPHSD